MKTITICGSLKYQKEMMEEAQKLAMEGNCVLAPTYKVLDEELTNKQLKLLKEEHLKRIEISDEIYVVNVDNYIGESTKLEIEYAKNLGKKINYML